MFEDNNLILFLMCIIPIVFYSIIIFANSPTLSIRFKTSLTYLYIGLLSVTLLQFFHFIFPHLHDTFFKISLGDFTLKDKYFEVYQKTLGSLLLFAFVQVALMEELSKWMAFKCVDYMRGKRRKNLDHPYAIMFYSALVSAAFAIAENIQYAQRAMVGEFGEGVTAENVLIVRAVSSVLIHMTCGLFMGYYIALAKNTSVVRKTLYNIIGISAAAFMHGVYDFNWMKPDTNKDYYNLFGSFPIHVSSTIIIGFALIISLMMSYNLKHIKYSEIKPQ